MAYTFPHGLLERPNVVELFIRCKSADQTFSVGDEVIMDASQFGETYGANAWHDATNIYLVTQPTYTVSLRPKTGGGANTRYYIDSAKWDVGARARVTKG